MLKYKNVLSLHLIQNIRIIHALSESGINVEVDAADLPKFSELSKVFKLNIHSNEEAKYNKIDSCTPSHDINISHSEPSVRFGSISKPLLFPKELFFFMKDKWPSNRNVKVCFSGLMTEKRKLSINNWLESNNIQSNNFKLSMLKLVQYLPLRLRVRTIKSFSIKLGPLVISDSINGRVFPKKSLDLNYYNGMLSSDFVLCPNGDYIWTYRFFESIICGAIPIVEDDCKAYEGFRYRKMNEKLSEFKWSEEDAEFNFYECLKRLTLSAEESKLVNSYFS